MAKKRAEETAAETAAEIGDEELDTRGEAVEGEEAAAEEGGVRGEEAVGVEVGVEESLAERLQAELDELKDRHLRLAAEFDNFRKRTARERADGRVRAQGELLESLLEPLDDLARVAHPDHAQANSRDVIAGVELVERKLLKQLEAVGLEQLGEPGEPFDPNVHEAVASAPAESEAEDQTVAVVMQVGYRFHGLLLRPARVQVRVWAGASDTG